MDRIDAMRVFLRVVERQSFAQAAHDLAIGRSRVSEAIQQLEKKLGVRLLTRTTRQIALTTEGEEYYHRCMAIINALDFADEAVTGTIPAGTLRIEVHGTMARRFIVPRLSEFLDAHPGIQLHISEGDRLADLVAEGIDCAIRVGEPADSGLIGRQVGKLEQGTFASSNYLDRNGRPQTLSDLAGHRMVGFLSSKTKSVVPLEFQTPGGLQRIALPAPITVTAAATNACLAIHGAGLIQVPRYRVTHELETGLLEEVLAGFPPEPMPVYILYPGGRHLSSRTRVFIDWASDVLKERIGDSDGSPQGPGSG